MVHCGIPYNRKSLAHFMNSFRSLRLIIVVVDVYTLTWISAYDCIFFHFPSDKWFCGLWSGIWNMTIVAIQTNKSWRHKSWIAVVFIYIAILASLCLHTPFHCSCKCKYMSFVWTWSPRDVYNAVVVDIYI